MEEKKKIEELFERFIAVRLNMLDSGKRYSRDATYCVLTMPKDIPVVACQSSNVEAFGYHEKSKTLKVLFKGGGEYRYLNVPTSAFAVLESAQSKGKALVRIKTMCDFVRINSKSFGEGKENERQAIDGRNADNDNAGAGSEPRGKG